jgi:hemerythrin-like domain-containing protein
MHAIKLLKQQHQDVRDLFERLGQIDDTNQKESLFQQLADNLAAHMTIEEAIFYPAAYTSDDTQYSEAVEEHATAKRILLQLLGMACDDENFDDKVTRLQEIIETHVEEEESVLFKAAKKQLDMEELEQLGDEMQQLFDEEMAGQPCRCLAEDIAIVEEEVTIELELDPNSELSAGK